MTRHRALLVDDERLARRRLGKLLARHPNIEIAGEAEDVDAAVVALDRDASLNLIFLDVQMPGGSGFELFARTQVRASVVFVTAYDQHALRAFEVNALDYILKPVDPAHLARAISRLQPLGAWSSQALAPEDRVCLQLGGATRFIDVTDIACIRAEGDYTEVCLRSGEAELVRVTMREWERRLPTAYFVRVHRSALLGILSVRRLGAGPGSAYEAEVEGVKGTIRVSRSQFKVVRERLGAG